MRFSDDLRSTTGREMITISSAIVALVVICGVARGYSFIPNQLQDGFLSQIIYARNLIINRDWPTFLNDPLAIIHTLRLVVVWPFLTAEKCFGASGSTFLLCITLWPLLISSELPYAGWRGWALLALRLTTFFLPLLASGRTTLVAAGMGYLVLGMMRKVYSWRMMLVGSFLAVLSSASILFSIAILIFTGNYRNSSPRFHMWKAFMVVLLSCLFMPSVIAKIGGFSSGAPGYAAEVCLVTDTFGNGAFAAVQRVLVRSTVAQSYCEGNKAKIIFYLGLFSAAIAFVGYSKITRANDRLNGVLIVLSTGILLEGLALWPILFPLVWAYTRFFQVDSDRDT